VPDFADGIAGNPDFVLFIAPPILDQVGLASALKYIDGFAKRSGIDVGLVITQEFDRLPREMEADLFRIVGRAFECPPPLRCYGECAIGKAGTQVVLQIREGRGLQPQSLRQS
jgi:hypothetical protein